MNEKDTYLAQAQKTSEEILARFPKCKSVANTFRFDFNGGIKYYTTLFSGNKFYVSTEFQSAKILDKVGSGDCFMAGLIYGFYHKNNPQQIVNFAAAAAFNKLFIPSDCTTASVNQILEETKVYEN
jgi:2-dehydro-3-deoxygluconokinase